MAERHRTCVSCQRKTSTLHLLPKTEVLMEKWLQFIVTKNTKKRWNQISAVFGAFRRRWPCLVSGISTTRLLLWVISAMVKKELGERNSGFWLPEVQEPRNGAERDCCECLPLDPRFLLPRDHRLGAACCRRRWCLSAETPAGENHDQQSLSSPCRGFSLLQIVVDVEETRDVREPDAVVCDSYRLEAHTAFGRDDMYCMI